MNKRKIIIICLITTLSLCICSCRTNPKKNDYETLVSEEEITTKLGRFTSEEIACIDVYESTINEGAFQPFNNGVFELAENGYNEVLHYGYLFISPVKVICFTTDIDEENLAPEFHYYDFKVPYFCGTSFYVPRKGGGSLWVKSDSDDRILHITGMSYKTVFIEEYSGIYLNRRAGDFIDEYGSKYTEVIYNESHSDGPDEAHMSKKVGVKIGKLIQDISNLSEDIIKQFK